MQMVMGNLMVGTIAVENRVNMNLFNNKKGQGLTLNTVIIAVLVLIVLAILIFIAYKYIWGAGSSIGELSSCAARSEGSKTAECLNTCPSTSNGFYKMGGCGSEATPGKYCCIPK
jgi:hypothetical protein